MLLYRSKRFPFGPNFGHYCKFLSQLSLLFRGLSRTARSCLEKASPLIREPIHKLELIIGCPHKKDAASLRQETLLRLA